MNESGLEGAGNSLVIFLLVLSCLDCFSAKRNRKYPGRREYLRTVGRAVMKRDVVW